MISPGDIAKAALWVTGIETGTLVRDPALSRWGISLRYHPDLGEAGIIGMTQDRAAGILGSQYWDEEWNGLPQYLAVPLLSFSVLESPEQAVLALQRALGVKPDGQIGPATCAAAQTTDAAAKRDAFLTAFFRTCRQRFTESPRWNLDGEGWVARQLAASLAAKTWAA